MKKKYKNAIIFKMKSGLNFFINDKNINRVLVISIDTLSYDCIGFSSSSDRLSKYGLQNWIKTPVIDEIASKSSYFTNCFSTSSYTPPAHASLFTGLYPPNHGVRPFFYKKLNENYPTLAEIFKDNGYKTIFSMDMDIFGPVGLTRGFDYIVTGNDAKTAYILDEMKDEKIFLFVHMFDVHDPYLYCETPPEKSYNDDYYEAVEEMSSKFNVKIEEKEPHKIWKELQKKVKNGIKEYLPLYVKGINKFDGGRFKMLSQNLKNFGFFDYESVYCILSDHGEGRVSYSDQSVFSHAGELFDEIIHIPLIFHAPGFEDKIRKEIVSIADIFPSVVSCAGLKLSGFKGNGDNKGEIKGDNNGKGKALLEKLDGKLFPGMAKSEPDGMAGGESYSYGVREFCYSEYFANKIIGNRINKDANKGGEGQPENAGGGVNGKGGEVLNVFSSEDDFFLFQRSVRTRDEKFVYYGVFFDGDISYEKFILKNKGLADLSDEDYVKSLYKIVLNRFEDQEGLSAHIGRLKSKEKTREDIFKEFIGSLEYAQRPKIFYYDLKSDPAEESPVDLKNLNDTGKISETIMELKKEAENFLEIIDNMEKNAPEAQDIFDETNEVLLTAKNTDNAGSHRRKRNIVDLLASKIDFSIDIIKEVYERFGKNGSYIGIAFTGGKDSTVMLDLVRKAFDGSIPSSFKIVNVDTTVDFPEIYEFIGRLSREWNFDLNVFANKEAVDKNEVKIAADKEKCCLLLKTVPLKKAITDLNLKALMTAIRKDEQEQRKKESYFSERNDPKHFRVHPLLHFTEKDIWDYIEFYDIPYCSLYSQGYRSLGCVPCTVKARPDEPERAGRSQEKEKIMGKLRDLGYF
ncbi:MAG: phosphoadenosine phosphosulfate reductase family protein [Deltaproteobacteria bacterium]|nr:phosphoadenosine phosphosulfate reductase family protein [Deltaproteobacteria bacterium]